MKIYNMEFTAVLNCMMLETKLTVEKIAIIVGYENVSFFFRSFKKRYGMTPKQYCKLNKK